jgi:hypothetical protein
MPLQNRVNPYGEIVSYPERGTLTGNRGILHNDRKEIIPSRVPWRTKAWIICLLEFKGWKREVMSARRTWTELFFLDEATALSAGHRPCATCQRGRYKDFKQRWQMVHGDKPIDATLHEERTDAKGSKRTYRTGIDTLPDGVFIVLEGDAYLIWQGKLLKWSPAGYTERIPKLTEGEVEVLTPPSTVAVLKVGYQPTLHESAG